MNILGKAVPLANLPNSFYEVSDSRPQDSDDFTFKIDHSLTSSTV